MMKRLVSATLALSLLGVTAASARPWSAGRHMDRGSHYSYSHNGWHGGRYYHNDGAGAALGIGLGLFALAAIASQNDRYDYGPPPPPPPPAYGGGYYGGYYNGY